MRFTASQPFRGDTSKAFHLAESALTAVGFRLTERTTSSLMLDGPGLNNSRESGLLGASRIHINAGSRELRLEADLGGLARLSWFVTLFPPGLCLFLGVVLSTVFTIALGPGAWIYLVAGVCGGLFVLWMFLGPWMARLFRRRTDQALTTLLANMVTVGESG